MRPGMLMGTQILSGFCLMQTMILAAGSRTVFPGNYPRILLQMRINGP